MTIEVLDSELRTLEIPVAYRAFNELTSPPFLVYYFAGSDDLKADDTNYVKVNEINIELYTRIKDLEVEAIVENKLKSLNLTWEKNEVWIEAEKVYQITYEISIIE